MTTQPDWAHDDDLFDPDSAVPHQIWAELRTVCPVAHTDRYGGSWLTTTYEDVTRVARDPATFSSRNIRVVPPPDGGARLVATANTIRVPSGVASDVDIATTGTETVG